MDKLTLVWLRRDLRLLDNTALCMASQNEDNVLPLFIFDSSILGDLEDRNDARVTFIYDQLMILKEHLEEKGSSLLLKVGKPLEIFQSLAEEYNLTKVYTNRDYEPYAIQRDKEVAAWLEQQGIAFIDFKDQVIFEKEEIMNDSGTHYKVFTPYKRAWLAKYRAEDISTHQVNYQGLCQTKPLAKLSLSEIGFERNEDIPIPNARFSEELIKEYHHYRDFPALEKTTELGLHLRFGTISIRKLVHKVSSLNETFLGELIWREFFMMILYHNPRVVDESYKEKYDRIKWRNEEGEFRQWCEGKTGYPLVDAGMRQLNQTGFMHNRVRMVVASFLTKHLLIDWRWGEAYFARKLLDYELSSNNGNWQWAAGTGTDAQPYFRIFNPASQQKKFDNENKYIKKWVQEYGSDQYPEPMVEHKMARERALKAFKSALDQ